MKNLKVGSVVEILSNRDRSGMYHIFEVGAIGQVIGITDGNKHHVQVDDIIQIVKPNHMKVV